ncbi:gasdermin-E-like [Pholidichthys leucotaenia]
MFEIEAKELVNTIGCGELIANKNVFCDMDLLTLVRITEGGLWQVPKYKILTYSLSDLTDEKGFDPGFKEEEVLSNYKRSEKRGGSGSVAGGYCDMVDAGVTASFDIVDGMSQPVNIMKKTVNFTQVKEAFHGRTAKMDILDTLRLKDGDKLGYIYQRIYNNRPVELSRKSNMDGSVSASCKQFLKVLVKGRRMVDTSFTVKENSTYAYGLCEITIKDNKLELSPQTWTHKRKSLVRYLTDSTDVDSSEILQQVKNELKIKEGALNPLAVLSKNTRCDLLTKLREIVEDEEACSLLVKTMDEGSGGVFECPQSEVVTLFLDLLKETPSTMSTPFIKIPDEVAGAVELLVTALDLLPGDMASLLTNCSPDTLSVLNQLVDKLKGDGEVQLPEPLPLPLREEGEMHWLVQLLRLTDHTSGELSHCWDQLDLSPEVLLEVLCLSVRGLNLMQPGTPS